MPRSNVFITLCLMIAMSLPHVVAAQNTRLIVLSARVGSVIDSAEAARFKLFQRLHNYHSAVAFQAPDSTFRITLRLKSNGGTLCDSTYPTSYGVLKSYAGWIDHFEEIEKGTYKPDRHPLLFDDSSVVTPPNETMVNAAGSAHGTGRNLLPLASNSAELIRPMFSTIGFDISIGAMISDLSELDPLNKCSNSLNFQGAVYFHIPLWEEPQIRFMSGWSSSMNGRESGSITSFSAYIVCQPWKFRYLSLFAGLGAAHTSFGFSSDSVVINAYDAYPVVVLGAMLVPDIAYLLVTVPLERSLATTFEMKSYAIKPAGITVNFLISL